jgi:hypothetical protein
MVAGRIAAHSVSDMFERCNFTLEACRAYGESRAVVVVCELLLLLGAEVRVSRVK